MASRRSLPCALWLLSGSVIACSAVGGGVIGVDFVDSGASRDTGRRDGTANRSDGAAGTSDAGRVDGASLAPTDGGAPALDVGEDVMADDGGAAPADVAPGCGPRELCGNGVDDDCNGTADDNCTCVPGTTQRCYGGDPARAGRGACGYGMATCAGSGEFGRWGACEAWGRPMEAETCGNAVDDDCDGMTDEGCLCNPGEMRACYSGPTSTRGVGACSAGTQTCTAREGGADWGPCAGEVLPEPDRCDGTDRDCDGNPNTGCVCVVGTSRSCYSGAPSTVNVGLCRAGTETCMRDKMSGQTGWGACMGEVIPATDRCDGMDRDCDGNPNTGCACTLGASRACYDGPPGTQDVGVCRAGTQRCEMMGAGVGWTACAGVTRPGTETCGNGMDDNCNGTADEGCVTCLPPRRMCPSGCVDVLTDRNNCGACGVVCPAGRACANGVCVGDGMLRITMVWSLAGDMDLHVVPPCGSEISYRATSQCGGQLDRDDTTGTGPENVFWAASPASGTYLVCATPYSIRGSTPFTVTVNQGATVLRRWTGTRTSSSSYVRCSRTSPYFLGDFTL